MRIESIHLKSMIFVNADRFSTNQWAHCAVGSTATSERFIAFTKKNTAKQYTVKWILKVKTVFKIVPYQKVSVACLFGDKWNNLQRFIHKFSEFKN